MYTPDKFRVADLSEIHEFMRAYSFATLISVHDARPVVSHIPLHLDNSGSGFGKLRGHFARANLHWQHMAESPETLVIFHGPHEYITPAWYEAKPLNVPTWNYMSVHAQGVAEIVGEEKLIESLQHLIVDNEVGKVEPWIFHLSDEMREKMLPQIVGFEISITSLDGKYKISQNRMKADQRRVMQELKKMNTPAAQAMAGKMKDYLGVNDHE